MTHPLTDSTPAAPVHRARLRVSVELLQQMLRMPEGTRIVGAVLEPDGRTISMTLEDPRIQATEEGYEIPEIEPLYSSYTPENALLIQAAWPFEHGTETTGDPFPDDEDPPPDEKDPLLFQDTDTPRRFVRRGDQPRISGTDPDGRDV